MFNLNDAAIKEDERAMLETMLSFNSLYGISANGAPLSRLYRSVCQQARHDYTAARDDLLVEAEAAKEQFHAVWESAGSVRIKALKTATQGVFSDAALELVVVPAFLEAIKTDQQSHSYKQREQYERLSMAYQTYMAAFRHLQYVYDTRNPVVREENDAYLKEYADAYFGNQDSK